MGGKDEQELTNLLVLEEDFKLGIVKIVKAEGKNQIDKTTVELRVNDIFVSFVNQLKKQTFNQIVLERDFISAAGNLLKPNYPEERSLYFETSLESFNLFSRMPFVNEKHKDNDKFQVHAFMQLPDIAKDLFLINFA
jgi:hypothetical protein